MNQFTRFALIAGLGAMTAACGSNGLLNERKKHPNCLVTAPASLFHCLAIIRIVHLDDRSLRDANRHFTSPIKETETRVLEVELIVRRAFSRPFCAILLNRRCQCTRYWNRFGLATCRIAAVAAHQEW